MKKVVSLLVTLSLMLTLFGGVSVVANQASIGNPIVDDNHNMAKFDLITFGSYYQSDLKQKDPIKWIVLSVSEDDIFCVSEKVLDTITVPNVDPAIPSIKKQIEILYNKLFTTAEQNAIKMTEWDRNILYVPESVIPYINFKEDIITNYCTVYRYLVDGVNSKTKGSVEIPASYDYRFKKYCWDETTGLRPAIHIRKSSNLWKNAGVLYNNKQYFNPKKTKIKKIKAKKKSVKVVWTFRDKYDGVMGYQIQYSNSKKFKKAKIITVNTRNKNCLTIKKLKSKKRYYLRVRTYSNIWKPDNSIILGQNGRVHSKRYYSKWSKVKSKKTK